MFPWLPAWILECEYLNRLVVLSQVIHDIKLFALIIVTLFSNWTNIKRCEMFYI